MGFSDDLTAEVVKIFKEGWTQREGRLVPDTTDLALRNDAITLKGAVLYADLADSTGLVSTTKPTFAAAVYKTYLNCACRIIRANGGEITAFDGDRVMAVYLGDAKETAAMKSALQINYAVVKIINVKLREEHPQSAFVVRQAVGVDTGDLLVARTGIRGSNDLVWVGPAANIAAKLCGLREGNYASWVTAAVHGAAKPEAKTGSDGRAMWDAVPWTARGGASVFRSAWTWTP